MTFLGIDIGTGSSKATATDGAGTVIATVSRAHQTASPRPGWFEHDATHVWWGDVTATVTEMSRSIDLSTVEAVCISGIGPVVLLADGDNNPLRTAILYGIDTRSTSEIATLEEDLAGHDPLRHTGNRFTTQSIGPKLRWLARHDQRVWQHARRWFNASSFIVAKLTGEYVLDHYTASASDPLYDLAGHAWWEPGWAAVAGDLERPRLVWPDEIVAPLLPDVADQLGLPRGIPIIAGTIDAMAEAYSVGCTDPGDMMVMYGSTMFFIQVIRDYVVDPRLWAVGGRTTGYYGLAAGMSTSGLIMSWLADTTRSDVGTLVADAATSPPGSNGLMLLPYFAGERTPIFDPDARGCWLGLTLDHRPADLARSALEGISAAVRHNVETMSDAGATPSRLLAVGGGVRSPLWMQIVSDMTKLPQDVATVSVGASYGDARMAADALGVDTHTWNPTAHRILPNPDNAAIYDEVYRLYRTLYPAIRDEMHLLGDLSRRIRHADTRPATAADPTPRPDRLIRTVRKDHP